MSSTFRYIISWWSRMWCLINSEVNPHRLSGLSGNHSHSTFQGFLKNWVWFYFKWSIILNHRVFVEHWNSQKSLSSIQQCASGCQISPKAGGESPQNLWDITSYSVMRLYNGTLSSSGNHDLRFWLLARSPAWILQVDIIVAIFFKHNIWSAAGMS